MCMGYIVTDSQAVRSVKLHFAAGLHLLSICNCLQTTAIVSGYHFPENKVCHNLLPIRNMLSLSCRL